MNLKSIITYNRFTWTASAILFWLLLPFLAFIQVIANTWKDVVAEISRAWNDMLEDYRISLPSDDNWDTVLHSKKLEDDS